MGRGACAACIILGIACGLVSIYFIRSMSVCEGMFGKLKQHRWAKLALGGVLLSSLIFVFPVLYGEGYSAINVLLNGTSEADWNELLHNSMFSGNGKWLILFIALVILTKTFATAATNGGGGCGGTFAPSLFVGAFWGSSSRVCGTCIRWAYTYQRRTTRCSAWLA